MRQQELIEQVRAYDPSVNEEALNRAYDFSMDRHRAQVRESGQPYFSHPLEVAGILASYRLDSATIATGLLHDTVEDGVASAEEIRALFGREVSALVDGVTRLSKIRRRPASGGEDLRKFVLAMTEDIRVLFVKLADRLHNMRTLGHIRRPERRRRIAEETLDLYAPLARRVGVIDICEELEDLAFAELHPEAREGVLNRIRFLHEQSPGQVRQTQARLRRVLAKAGVEAEVSGREKKPYSIWRKMQRKNVPIEDVTDIYAFRVVTSSVADCYQALGLVHGAWRFVPGRFKDHISVPKPNGYRSLHTVAIGPHRRRVEIQIRTRDMHRIAEYGLAAHWLYKERGSGPADLHRAAEHWLQGLRQIVESAADHEEGLEDTKLEMYTDLVFCFTPQGDVLSLPSGATPVDFAYAVHTRVGETCVGCKVNGRPAPLNASLANGDQVEILRSRGQQPQPNWESFVRTGRARSQIRRFLRAKRRNEFAKLGEKIVAKAFADASREFRPKAIEPALRPLGFRSRRALFAAVGSGELAGHAVLQAVHPSAPGPKPRRRRRGQAVEGAAVGIRGLTPGVAVHLAECCSPIPGERIVGVLTEGQGASVHTIDCETLERFVNEPERWLDLKWAEDDASAQVARLRARVTHKPGSLNALASVIAGAGANVTNLRILHRSVDVFELEVGVAVDDVRHLGEILNALRARPEIFDVERIRG